MRFWCEGITLQGQSKHVNQDGFCIKRAETPWGDMALLVVCDGMGGLDRGELASATVVRAFSRWFQEDLPVLAEQLGATEAALLTAVQNQWLGLLQGLNLKIMQYAHDQGISMGTTCTALFACGDSFLVVHVGDTRVYCLRPRQSMCITTDQTFVQQEIAAGKLTAVEAALHPQRNALVQCVGASKALDPQVVQGSLDLQAQYLLCSDGFRQLITPTEMDQVLREADQLSQALESLAQVAVARGERDDLTALVLRPWAGGDSSC